MQGVSLMMPATGLDLSPEQIRDTFAPGTRVEHKRESGLFGTIVSVDWDCALAEMYGNTTCLVNWDPEPDDGFFAISPTVAWINKLNILKN
jgi:hypothetical protein